MENCASSPSGRVISMAPPPVTSLTSVIPGPLELTLSIGTLSRSVSQATSRSALGLAFSAETLPPLILAGYWSSAAASRARQGVSRVHERSVLPSA